MAMAPRTNLSEVAEAVARELVSAEYSSLGSIVRTPILYPSGASVVVQITQHADRYFVTDMGFGFQEAEMIGAGIQYSNSAKGLADHFGIRFDNQAFFLAEADRGQLVSAVTIVANCSGEAASLAVYKAAERKFEEDTDKLYRKLVSVFSKSEVERDVDFVGSSTHSWPVAAVVRHAEKVAIFEPVSKNHISVVNTAAKFHDIARLDHPPRRIAVVNKKAEMGEYLNLLSQAGNVIEYETPNEKFRDLAEAA
jgi:hypothetical protein